MLMTLLWIILALLYVISRFDLIPDFFTGWGWIDDIIVLVLLYRYLVKKYRRPRPGAGQQQQSGHQEGAHQDEPSSSAPKSPYTVLEVSPGASREEIHAAYRRLANQYHPDKVAHLGPEFQELAEQRFKEIQQAYQTLTGGNHG